jgi:hypothetical protein
VSEPEAKRRKGFTELIVESNFGQTIGETMFLEDLLTRRGLDLSSKEGQDFLSRFVVGQLKTNIRLARAIDELKEEVAQRKDG